MNGFGDYINYKEKFAFIISQSFLLLCQLNDLALDLISNGI